MGAPEPIARQSKPLLDEIRTWLMTQRALRSGAVGRKNRYESRSERGTRTSALFFSLLESAKLCCVEPRAYLREATLRVVRDTGAVTLARDVKSPES